MYFVCQWWCCWRQKPIQQNAKAETIDGKLNSSLLNVQWISLFLFCHTIVQFAHSKMINCTCLPISIEIVDSKYIAICCYYFHSLRPLWVLSVLKYWPEAVNLFGQKLFDTQEDCLTFNGQFFFYSRTHAVENIHIFRGVGVFYAVKSYIGFSNSMSNNK